jgi:hypothetical protein
MKKIISSVICLSVAFAFAASVSDSLYSLAQKLYSQGNFEAAAKNYADACPQFAVKEKKLCHFNEAKALIESQNINLLRAAEPKLLLLISQTEPNDSLFTELSAEDAKLQIMLNQPVRAVRSWNAAQASASTDYFPELFVLCKDIVSAFPSNGLNMENCNRVKPADTSLISLPRKKIVPLNTSNNAPPNTPSQAPPAPPPPPVKEGKWYVQLGAFGSLENAERLVADFKNRGVELYIVELPDRKLFAVRTGFFVSAEDAKIFAEQKIEQTHKDYKIFQ